MLRSGTVICRYTVSPSRRAVTARGASGAMFSGARGGPFLPQAGEKTDSRRQMRERTIRRIRLQNIAREILVLRNRVEHAVDVSGVDAQALVLQLGRVERHLVEQLFHDGVEPARADVLGAIVDEGGDVGDALDGVGRELQLDVLG